mmetsp:Transcript_16627/g.23691  ORF Transcript_16627/g.23691 Transcript_16627/m.23691 type:complete len:246 (+) Transcript_16627:901-1638(+)
MDNNSPGTQDSHANPSGPREEVTMTDTASITEHASPSQPEGEEHPEVQVTMDYLRSLLDVPLLDPSRLQKTPSKFPEVVQVVPEGFHKIRFEINAEFPKNTPKIDRILSIFDVARRYDKSVCLCPSGKEPHPVLYTPTDIKQSRFHRYFQDKPGAKSTRHDDRTGGAAVLTFNHWACTVVESGQDDFGCGWWCYTTLQGRNKSRLTIVGFYRSNKPATGSGPTTAHAQAMRVLGGKKLQSQQDVN